jgi:hypothetical protein
MRLGALKLRAVMQLLGVDVAYFFRGYPGTRRRQRRRRGARASIARRRNLPYTV